MSTTENQSTSSVPVDNFKLIEKSVKNLVRTSQEEISGKKKKKKIEAVKEPVHYDYSWKDIIDPRAFSSSVSSKKENTEEDVDSRLELISDFTTSRRCLSNRPHVCQFEGTHVTGSPSILRLRGSPSGLFILSNALCLTEQLFWSGKCVSEYSLAEYTNLTNLENRYSEAGQKSPSETSAPLDVKEQKKENQTKKDTQENLFQNSVDEKNNFLSFKKLRWSCLGYHYDWTERCYSENAFTPFPTDLSSLSSHLISRIEQEMKERESDYRLSLLPEAAIINYYPMSSTMGGHIDDSEHNLVDPIISFSLGTSAIFLIGTHEKSFAPHALLLRSGDVVVMSNEARIGYHGVPALLSKKLEDAFLDSSSSTFHDLYSSLSSLEGLERFESSIEDYKKESEAPNLPDLLAYLSENRLNMNIRQVKFHSDDPWFEKKGKTTREKLQGALGMNQV